MRKPTPEAVKELKNSIIEVLSLLNDKINSRGILQKKLEEGKTLESWEKRDLDEDGEFYAYIGIEFNYHVYPISCNNDQFEADCLFGILYSTAVEMTQFELVEWYLKAIEKMKTQIINEAKAL
jgi:hypothetical protein